MGSFNANPTLIMAGVVTSNFRPRVENSVRSPALQHKRLRSSRDGLTAAEVDPFFRLARNMIQNLNYQNRGSRFRTFSIGFP